MQYLWTSKYRLSITDFIFNSIWTIFNHVQLQEVHEDDHKRKSRAKKNDTKSKFRSKSEERAKSGPASLTQNVVFQEDIASPSSHSAFSETSVWSYLLCIICLLHFGLVKFSFVKCYSFNFIGWSCLPTLVCSSFYL